MSSGSRQSAFTLIEILVAVAVLAILALAAYGGLDALIASRQYSRREYREFKRVELAIVTIDRDLEQSAPRPIRRRSGALAPAMHGGTNEVPFLAFTRAGWPNPLQKPRSSLMRINYRLEKGQLIRLSYPVLDRSVTLAPRRQVLLKGIEKIKLRFLRSNGQWIPLWPPLDASSDAYLSREPLAVQLTLVTKHWGRIRRIVELIR